MITISTDAAAQIKESAKQSQAEGLALRLAANKKADGSLEYAMGFADRDMDDDIFFESEGVKIIVSAGCYELLKNTQLDFVKLDDIEEKQFIFKNPNDPAFKVDGSGSGADSDPSSNSGNEHHY